MTKKIEQKALVIAIIGSLIMGITGFIVYKNVRIGAIFLDASFSIITSVSYLSAIIITNLCHKKTSKYPNGKYMLEPLYTIVQSFLTLFLLIYCSYEAFSNILLFLFKDSGQKLKIGPLIPYTIVMVLLSFFLSLMFKKFNKKINNASIILEVGKKSSFIDGIISSGIGISLLVISLFKNSTVLSYIGDNIITLMLVIFLIGEPLEFIYNSFLEISKAVINNEEIETIVKNELKAFMDIKKIDIIKIGKQYEIKIYINDNKIYKNQINIYKKDIRHKLKHISKQLNLEFIL